MQDNLKAQAGHPRVLEDNKTHIEPNEQLHPSDVLKVRFHKRARRHNRQAIMVLPIM
jgi:hypothetical protein